MAAFFFDSSALAKCYIDEVGSVWSRTTAARASGNDIHVLRIAEVEVTSAVLRRRKGGTLSANDAAAALSQLQNDLANDFIVLELSRQLFASAVALVHTHELRAYDAVQLAGAVELNRLTTSHIRPCYSPYRICTTATMRPGMSSPA